MARRGQDQAAGGEAAFSPALLEVLERPPSPLPRAVLGLLLALLAALLAWAALGRLDIVARAEGRLVPRERLQVVQPLEGGRVREILAREGQRVRAGQTLVVMDASLNQAELARLEAERASAVLERERVRAELDGAPFRAPPEADPERAADMAAQYRANREAQERALEEQRSALRAAERELARAREVRAKLAAVLPIRSAREEALERLGESGYARRLEVLDSRGERIATERDLRAQGFAIEALEARVAQARERGEAIRVGYRRRLLAEKLTLSRRITELDQEIRKLRFRARMLELRAPRDGIVQDLALHTAGSVVPAGSVLLTLVPAGAPLLAEVLVENRDVGFVAPGQRARVKLLAYEFQRYGTLEGRVEQVSPDAVDPGREPGAAAGRYRALVALETQRLEHGGKSLALRPGMRVSAEIRLGSRTVLDYVLSPIRRAVAEAGQER